MAAIHVQGQVFGSGWKGVVQLIEVVGYSCARQISGERPECKLILLLLRINEIPHNSLTWVKLFYTLYYGSTTEIHVSKLTNMKSKNQEYSLKPILKWELFYWGCYIKLVKQNVSTRVKYLADKNIVEIPFLPYVRPITRPLQIRCTNKD